MYKRSEVGSFYAFKIDHFINIAPHNFMVKECKRSEVRSIFKIDHFINIAPSQLVIQSPKKVTPANAASPFQNRHFLTHRPPQLFDIPNLDDMMT